MLRREVPTCKSMISELSGADADVKLKELDRIYFGNRYLTCVSTPGHTLVSIVSIVLLEL